jgi:hypothetical protein
MDEQGYEAEQSNRPADEGEARPPTRPPTAAAREPSRPAWPTVFGVLGVIYASLGLLGGCCTVAQPMFWPPYVEFLKETGATQDMIDQMNAGLPPIWWAIISGILSLVMATLLMVGSIRLLRRQPSGVRLCTIWSIITLGWTPIGIAVGVYFQFAALQEMEGPGMVGGLIGGCVGLVIGLLLPVFMLIWFNRAESKAEIARWSSPDA